MLISLSRATLLVIDIQEKLVPAVQQPEALLARTRWLLNASHDLGLPVVFSEQYPSGLGPTVESLLAVVPDAPVVEKTDFSCVAGHCLPTSLLQREQVILCGMETHVCVLQTALELWESGKQVFVVADCVSSRKATDHELSLQRMQAAGITLVTREMVLFELLRTSAHAQFRRISKTYLTGLQP